MMTNLENNWICYNKSSVKTSQVVGIDSNERITFVMKGSLSKPTDSHDCERHVQKLKQTHRKHLLDNKQKQ